MPLKSGDVDRRHRESELIHDISRSETVLRMAKLEDEIPGKGKN